MKILFAASEAFPFATSGGLGDVIGALPRALAKRGEKVSVIIPCYGFISQEYRASMEEVCSVSFNLGWRKTGASIYKTRVDAVDWYFVYNSYYFDRDKLYGEDDDGERFAFFSMAVLEFVRCYLKDTEIIHSNDWHTSLCNVYLKTIYSEDEILKNIRTVFTIHNVQYQGKFDPYILGNVFGLEEKYKSILEYNGSLNLMKGALVCADRITTVSCRYADELKYDYFGYGLSPMIKDVEDKLIGIINGIDYGTYSPYNGSDIFHPYSKRDSVSGKTKNKKALYDLLGIDAAEDDTLIVMVTRLTEQKGIDLVLGVLDEILAEKITMIILGCGDEKYEKALSEATKKYENLYVKLGFDKELSKKLYAAGDIFLMPSKSEPCGLSQMIACAYGTVPIVRRVGGLSNSIISYGEENSNGFVFDNYNAHELLYKIKDALNVRKNKAKWRSLILRCMSSDFSWDNSAEKYLALYREMLNL